MLSSNYLLLAVFESVDATSLRDRVVYHVNLSHVRDPDAVLLDQVKWRIPKWSYVSPATRKNPLSCYFYSKE